MTSCNTHGCHGRGRCKPCRTPSVLSSCLTLSESLGSPTVLLQRLNFNQLSLLSVLPALLRGLLDYWQPLPAIWYSLSASWLQLPSQQGCVHSVCRTFQLHTIAISRRLEHQAIRATHTGRLGYPTLGLSGYGIRMPWCTIRQVKQVA